MIIFLWIVFSIVVGVYASSKKVSGDFAFGFFISLFFSPVIGFIATALSKPSERELLKGGMKKCTHCAELVKREAIKCRYCGASLGNTKAVIETTLVADKEEEEKASSRAFIFLATICGLCLLLGLWFLVKVAIKS
jgi:RNA polymerase subunit RPABC4/transcription elongation factor Spt4